LFTISAPDTESAVVEANVRVLFVEMIPTDRRFVIVDEALFTINAPVTSKAVVEAYGNIEAVDVVAVKYPAIALFPREEIPSTESLYVGVEEPRPKFVPLNTSPELDVIEVPLK
jgi:hypothetical protein